MSVIDIDKLLEEIDPDAPCGEDLEYDPAFIELEQNAKGKPEQQMGDSVMPAEEPEWRGVKKGALSILERTKDLRTGVYLIRALVNTDGVAGLHDGLALLRGMVEQYWEPVHPRLDPDDNNDPMLRVNTLMSLCDRDSTLRDVRETPLVSSKVLGRFGLRDVDVATGKLSPTDSEGEPPKMSQIEAAFTECPLDDLRATTEAVGNSMEHLGAIEGFVTDQVGAANAPNFSPLVSELKAAHKTLEEQLARLAPDEAGLDGAGAEGEAGAAGRPFNGQITNRQDVVRALDAVCEYYNRNEPSSPVPLLVQRAKRLMSKDFMEILRDLAPDGATQAQVFCGEENESSEYEGG